MAKLHDKGKIISQQDLAPWHISNMVKAKMKKIKYKVLNWPTKSTNLNPIESVWSILDKKLMGTPIYNKATLRKQLEEKQKGLEIELCRSLADSMLESLEKSLLTKCGNFN